MSKYTKILDNRTQNQGQVRLGKIEVFPGERKELVLEVMNKFRQKKLHCGERLPREEGESLLGRRMQGV